jgi:hypothetical protein
VFKEGEGIRRERDGREEYEPSRESEGDRNEDHAEGDGDCASSVACIRGRKKMGTNIEV